MGSGAKPQRTTILVLFEHLERLFLALYFRDNYYISHEKINATGNPGCTLFNSDCTISAGNTLRIGAAEYTDRTSVRRDWHLKTNITRACPVLHSKRVGLLKQFSVQKTTIKA